MSDFDMPPVEAGFPARGRWLIDRLRHDLSLTENWAAGIVGNIGFESGGLTKLHEIGQPEGIGGYGWAQWTGPRRRTFFAWCERHGFDWQSDEANYDYLVAELTGRVPGADFRFALDALRKTRTIEEAVWSVGQTYERPGGTTAEHLPGYNDRLEYALEALGCARKPASAHPAVLAGDVAGDPVPAPTAAPDANGEVAAAVRVLQMALNAAGAAPRLRVDGDPGPRTQAACEAWRRATPS